MPVRFLGPPRSSRFVRWAFTRPIRDRYAANQIPWRVGRRFLLEKVVHKLTRPKDSHTAPPRLIE